MGAVGVRSREGAFGSWGSQPVGVGSPGSRAGAVAGSQLRKAADGAVQATAGARRRPVDGRGLPVPGTLVAFGITPASAGAGAGAAALAAGTGIVGAAPAAAAVGNSRNSVETLVTGRLAEKVDRLLRWPWPFSRQARRHQDASRPRSLAVHSHGRRSSLLVFWLPWRE